MKTSEHIGELAAALAKAQAQITGALKDSKNPFFKSSYADLASCWDACRKPLSDAGLAVVQTAESDDRGIFVVTRLLHSSGQWIEGELILHPKDEGPQAAGSVITYARRYALAAIVGLAQIDDDAEAAQARGKHDPKGDLGSRIESEQAQITANSMREAMNADVDEDVKAMRVLDLHDMLRTQHDLYTAGADAMTAAERGAWKKYVKIGQDRMRLEPPAANGRL